jgi:hypothetical protein
MKGSGRSEGYREASVFTGTGSRLVARPPYEAAFLSLGLFACVRIREVCFRR